MDWENDPELKQLRKTFLNSFDERSKKLNTFLEVDFGQIRPELLQECILYFHNLAGVCGSYGLSTLAQAAGCLEDIILYHSQANTLGSIIKLIHQSMIFIRELLYETKESNQDPTQFLRDPRMIELISFFELIPFESRHESS